MTSMRWVLGIGLILLGGMSAGAQGLASRTNLFTAGVGGYAVYRIPGILSTPGGAWLAWCEARRRTGSDWVQTDVLLRRSTDGGRSWSAPQVISATSAEIARNPVALATNLGRPEERTMHNPVMIAGRDGTVHLVFCAEYNRAFYARSTDDGATFAPAREITATFETFRPQYDWKVLATGPGHSIQLRSGRLLIPVWLSTGSGGGGHRPSCIATIYSDDQGETWKAGAIIADHSEALANPSEAVPVELADGRVLLNLRHETKNRRRGIAFSSDGATGWSPVRFDEALFEPVCMAGLVRVPGHSRERQATLVFANPDSSQPPTTPGAAGNASRRNLRIRLSADDGATWPIHRVLDAGLAGYSDLAVAADGTLLCLYESAALGGTAYNPGALTLARFDLDWLFGEDERAGDAAFQPLCNGHDLTGWINVNCAPDTWSVTNGLIACTGKPIGELRTTRMYQNFIFEVEWRHRKPQGNAGVFVWADALTARGQPFIRGVEVQVLDGREGESHTSDGDVFPIHGARMTPLNGRGGDRAFPVTKRARPSPEWNHYRITCLDGMLTLAVNGKVVTRGVGASPRKGYLCLESEGSPAEFRNLRMRELPVKAALAPEDIAASDEGYVSLYTGVDLSGWTASPADAPAWQVQDWVLRCRGGSSDGNGSLRTVREFGDAAVVMDWRWTDRNRRGDWTRLLRPRGLDLATALTEAFPVAGDVERPVGQWNRLHCRLRGNELSVRVNDGVERTVRLGIVAARGPLVLVASEAPVETANLFVRVLD